jgi:hypothetical protein
MGDKLTLYDTTAEFRDLLDLMEQCDEDPDPVHEAAIQVIVENQVHKVDNFSRFLTHLDSQSDLAAAEIKRLQDRKRAIERRGEQLRAYALRVMEQNGFDRLDGETASLVIRKNPPAVFYHDRDAVPAEFITVKQEMVIDTNRVKAALKAGQEVPGAQLAQGRKVVVK